MAGIFDQIINYSPPLIVSGTVNYKGTWNASTNNPTLNNPPAASTKGDYYVVSAAGTQFSITFAVGDWIISNGTVWEKVDLTDAVSSVFGRTGAVVGVSTDYSAVGLTNTAIGAANPAAGSFTTLGSSSTTTLNGTTIPASSTLLVSGGALGTPASGTVTNLTGTASINTNGAHNGTVGATTPSTGAFTTLSTNSSNGVTTLESPGTSSVGLQFRTNSNNRFKIETPSASADLAFYSAGTTEVARLSSTGLAVTGALSATGSLTTTTGSFFGVAGTFVLAAGAEGLVFGSSTAAILRAPSGTSSLRVGNTDIASASSTGLAVTGALSATTGTFSGILSTSSDYRLGGFSFLRTAISTGSGWLGGYNITFSSGVKHDSTGAIAGINYVDDGTVKVYGGTSQTAGTVVTPVATFSSTGLAVTGGITSTGVTLANGAIGTSYSYKGLHATGPQFFGYDNVVGNTYGGGVRGYSVAGQGGYVALGTIQNNTWVPALTIDHLNAATFSSGLAVTGTQKLVETVTVNSSTQTIVTNSTEGVSGLCWIRNASVGGQALVLWDISHGLTIVSQLGSIFTTSSPSATQIQLSVAGSSPYYVQAIAGATRNGNSLSISAINNQ
jgi:hypothetical protein